MRMLKIIDSVFSWKGALQKRRTTKYIVLHHRAGNGDVKSIHNVHLSNGWSGIGYHFYIRKDGSVYRGRPIGMVGAHCKACNAESVGICFEGNFETETEMSAKQIEAGKELVSYLLSLYPHAVVKKHRDFDGTLCPGKYFEFEKIRKGKQEMSVDEAVEIVQAKAGLEEGTIEFLLCYKYGEELIRKLAEAMI